MIRSSQDTRRWAFYAIGAAMCPEDTGRTHGPDATHYVIRSFGSQSNALVLDPNDGRRTGAWATRNEARAYADSLIPCMPSKCLPLRVQEVRR